MALATGSRLGPYEIVSSLGAGGMGEVYRAKDTRLEREVAVKVLPSHLSSSEEMRQRFEREAKAISQLSHAHICALYDVGREGDVEYLVMELLEGETLSDRLGKGPLPLEQTLKYGQEIADALDKAHRQGIVHRDLKPGNVMLTKSGVKLLDFGLAKAVAPVRQQSGMTSLPTMAGGTGQNLTEAGTILGTFQYMSPEQLEGKEADARSDIFAFGAVLYEMATGRKAFSGKSQASLIGSILRDDPTSISEVAPMTPPALNRVVKTCLAKDPEDRFQTAHDVKLQLAWVAEGGSQAGVPAPVVARRRNREKAAWVVAALALVAAGVAAWGYVRRAPAESFRIHSFLLPPDKTEFEDTGANCGALSLSPDGRNVIFAARGAEGKSALWLQSLGSLDAKPIPGTEGASFPFWSADSRYIAFFADGKLKKVDTAGSPPLDLCAAPNGRSGGWNRDGVILFSPDSTSAIFRVPAAGGKAEPVTKVDTASGETTHRWATFLPDGKHFLYMAASHGTGAKGEANAIYVAQLGSSDRTRLLQTRSNVAYASGRLLYMRENVLLAQRFDPAARKLTGDPVPLAEKVRFDGAYFRGEFSASDSGLLVYATGPAVSDPRLTWLDRAGKPVGEPFGEPARYTGLAVAPDGRRFAASIIDPGIGTPDVWIFDTRGVRTRFTFGAPADSPSWSKDGKRLAYSKLDEQSGVLCVKDASGGGQEQVLHRVNGLMGPDDWAPDGRSLLADVRLRDAKTKTDIWIIPADGSGKPRPFLATAFDERNATFSGDGKWVSYTSNESGRDELYVVPFPGPGGKWQVSTGGAIGGAFFKGGREILYGTAGARGPNADVFSVDVHVGPNGIELGPPRRLFELAPPDAVGITADGERFLVAFRPQAAAAPRVSLMTNWTAGLDAK